MACGGTVCIGFALVLLSSVTGTWEGGGRFTHSLKDNMGLYSKQLAYYGSLSACTKNHLVECSVCVGLVLRC